MNKKWLILICSFSLLTLICSSISIILLANIEKTHGEMNSNNILGNKKDIKKVTITYYENNNIDLIIKEKRFAIANTNSDTIKYKIEWENTNIINTTITNYNITLSCSNGEKITKEIPTTKNIIFENLELKTNQTNNCMISLNEINPTEATDKTLEATYKIIIDEEALS